MTTKSGSIIWIASPRCWNATSRRKWSLRQELLGLGEDYKSYLQEVAPVFGHRSKDDSRLARMLLRFDKVRKAEERMKHRSRDRQDERKPEDSEGIATRHAVGVEVVRMLATVVAKISDISKGVADEIERGQRGAA